MFDLLETFKIENGKIAHLAYHQARVNRSLLDLYQLENSFSIEDFIKTQALPTSGIYRGRLLYEEEIKHFEILPYKEQHIQTFQLVDAGEYEYPYKWADRDFFAAQKKLHQSDEIIYFSNNKIQDCSIANLAFLKNGQWYTPKSPMLAGTTRARLLDEHKIQELDIFTDEIHQYERICLINVFRELSFENSLLLADCIL
ncbi:MAG: Aminodeoxychorismate lyase [Bacteroidota bacterium]